MKRTRIGLGKTGEEERKSSDKKNEELHIQILKEINGMKNPNRKWKRKKY